MNNITIPYYSLIAAAIAVPFQPADEYMVQATMTLPYSHLSQPVILWYDS